MKIKIRLLSLLVQIFVFPCPIRGGSRAAATSKMERSVIIVNDFQSLTIITKHSILDVAAALYPPLMFRDNIYLYYETKNGFFI